MTDQRTSNPLLDKLRAHDWAHPIWKECAAEIERLTKERDAAYRAIEVGTKGGLAGRAENERLRAALEQIAESIERGNVEQEMPHDLRAQLRRIAKYAREALRPADDLSTTKEG